MNATDFRATILQLGMTQRSASRFFNRNVSTCQRWGKEGTPPEIDLWLKFMLAVQSGMHIKNVPEWICLMAGRKIEKSRKPKKISP